MSWKNLLAMLKRHSKAEREFNDEMRFHLERQIEQHLAAGLSPEEARRQALIEFGGVQQTRENVRETRSIVYLTSWPRTLAMPCDCCGRRRCSLPSPYSLWRWVLA